MHDVEAVIDETAGEAGPGVSHRSRWDTPYHTLSSEVYFPVNVDQFRGLIGKVLTHLDAMALPDRARRATKTLLVQTAWNWWSDAAENAATAGAGCLAPIVMNPRREMEMTGAWRPDEPPSNRWGWKSEREYLDSLPARNDE